MDVFAFVRLENALTYYDNTPSKASLNIAGFNSETFEQGIILFYYRAVGPLL